MIHKTGYTLSALQVLLTLEDLQFVKKHIWQRSFKWKPNLPIVLNSVVQLIEASVKDISLKTLVMYTSKLSGLHCSGLAAYKPFPSLTLIIVLHARTVFDKLVQAIWQEFLQQLRSLTCLTGLASSSDGHLTWSVGLPFWCH